MVSPCYTASQEPSGTRGGPYPLSGLMNAHAISFPLQAPFLQCSKRVLNNPFNERGKIFRLLYPWMNPCRLCNPNLRSVPRSDVWRLLRHELQSATPNQTEGHPYSHLYTRTPQNQIQRPKKNEGKKLFSKDPQFDMSRSHISIDNSSAGQLCPGLCIVDCALSTRRTDCPQNPFCGRVAHRLTRSQRLRIQTQHRLRIEYVVRADRALRRVHLAGSEGFHVEPTPC